MYRCQEFLCYSYWTMKPLLFAVLLSVMQAAPPVPRQTPNSTNQSTDKRQKKPSQHQDPIAQMPTPKNLTEKPVGEKATTDNPASPNTQQPIRVTELPTVSVTRDWMDKTSWAFGAILVGVGVVGVCAAYRTLRAIERQARIMRRQTAHIARQAVSMRRQTTILRKSAEATNRSVELQSVQWVTLKNWRTRLSQPHMLNVEVDLINETSFPLTLRGTTFQVGTAKFEGALDITVVPRAVHTVGCIRQLLQEEYTNYLSENGTTFGLRGAIRFVGVSGIRVQPFGGLVTTSFSGGTEFSSISEYEQSAKTITVRNRQIRTLPVIFVR